jgi:beta-galactosidase
MASLVFTAMASAAPVPISGVAPVPVDQLRVNNPAVLPMTGTWKFQISKGKEHAGAFVPEFSSVTASCAWPEHKAMGALGQPGEFWSASSGTFPQWWEVDFGQSQQLQGVQISFEDKNISYKGQVETSDNGYTWTPLADLKAITPADSVNVPMSPTECRYLRIMFTDGRSEKGNLRWAFIRHIQIMVERDGQSVVWTPALDADQAPFAKFADLDFDDSKFSTIPVPANWEVEGFSRPTYDAPDDAVGLYRRVVAVPASFADHRLLWHFDGVFETAEVFINGKRVGYHESGFTAFDMDVTNFVKPGQNNLFAVRVCKNADSVDLDTGDYWALGGIFRENYIVALPPVHVDDTAVVTTLDASYTNATLSAAIKVAGPPSQPFEVSSQLYQLDGTKAGTPEMAGSGTLDGNGNATVQLSQPVPAPKLWSAEKPNLYYLVTSLSSAGKQLEQTQARFGFKQIEIKNGVLLWNGVPIKCAGTCRHEEWSVSGHALTEQEWQTDVKLMKAANINTIRTSHYIDAERFLELCDEKGFYILDEIPFCWADPTDKSYIPAYLERTDEAYARDKNRPCVLAWSLGNESGFGPVNNAGFEEIKKLDPTRPAFISGATTKDNPELPILDFHYPGAGQVAQLIHNEDRKLKPALITEGPHTFYEKVALDYDYGVKDLWGQGLLTQWNLLWSSDTMLGGCIWEWQDQGLADKFPDRAGVDGEGLRSNNNKGFVDGYRNVKPEYFNVKMVYSPVVINGRNYEAAGNVIPVSIQNRYSFTNLSELTCHWQALAGNNELASGDKHIDCAPRSSSIANFDITPGMDTLRLEFIHPDGRSIYVARLEAKGTDHPAPPAAPEAGGLVNVRDEGGQVEASVGITQLTIDKSTGGIVSWTIGNQPIIAGGLILNLGADRKRGEGDSKTSLISSQPPELKNVVVTANQEAKQAKITVSSDVFLTESPESKGSLIETFDVREDGQIDMNWQLKWTAPPARVMELGMEIPVPPSLNHMHWRHVGLWTEYPPDHIGATEGDASPDDLTFRCTKRNLTWLTMGAPGQKYALCLLSEGTPLHSRGHLENGNLFLYASALNAPIQHGLVDGMYGNTIVNLKPGQTYTGSFSLRPVENAYSKGGATAVSMSTPPAHT